MTFVNLKQVESDISDQLLIYISQRPSEGACLVTVSGYPNTRAGRGHLESSVPGFRALSYEKRYRLAKKAINRLIRDERVRVVKGSSIYYDRLIALSVLDRIVLSLERDNQAEVL